MLKIRLFTFTIGVLIMFSLNAQVNNSRSNRESSATAFIAQIKITFNNHKVIIGLYDNPASQQLLAQLPLTLSFSDFAGAEKIAYPTKALSTDNTPLASQLTADVTYYAPWKNLALFYKGYGSANGLYGLGRIIEGKEKLAGMNGDFIAVIERAD